MKRIILSIAVLCALAFVQTASAQSVTKEKEVPTATVAKDVTKTPEAAKAAGEETTTKTATSEEHKHGSNCKEGSEKACCKSKKEGKSSKGGCCMPKETKESKKDDE